ncbi:MAG TPA: 4-(cytidine 5'-diphospho)-2-C-methyl-D-erythritol kinase [Symbiobacteriaceae bacterium]|nr:4-(cytidine 5'-diphospho)-2-C-methyl-D-erythritol kinase [Symbiobacteriaceae bacterium]
MESLVLQSPAKINLSLNVLGKRADGYHDVDMVMIPVGLADTLRLSTAADIQVICTPDVAGPPGANLAFRAAQALKAATGYPGGARIELTKVIPVAGGLAGGSTNAAAVLVGLNRLWETGLTGTDLEALAVKLGADVPFFITGRPARVQGIGERLRPVPIAQELWFVLATPPVAKSTGNVYRLLDELEQVNQPDVDAMEAAIATGDLPAVGAALGNVFEQVMLPRHPEIADLKAFMVREGAVGALMSGAGPTVFGLMRDEAAAHQLKQRLGGLGQRAFVASSLNQGE